MSASTTIQNKIIAMPIIAAVSFMLITVLAVYLNKKNDELAKAFQTTYYPIVEKNRDLEATFSELHIGFQNAVALEDTTLLEETDVLSQRFLAEINEALTLRPTETTSLIWLGNSFELYRVQARATVKRLILEGTSRSLIADMEEMTGRYRGLKEILLRNRRYFEDQIKIAFEAQRTRHRTLLLVIGILTILAILALFFISRILSRSIIAPLQQVVKLANQVSRGDFEVKIDVSGADEISVLKQAFRTMVNKIGKLLQDKDETLLELDRHRNNLEELVDKRTSEIKATNLLLRQEIVNRRRIEKRQTALLTEIEEANKELKDFAYVVSHDLKAPLRAIGSLSNWLLTDYEEKLDDEGRELVHMLAGRTKRMHNLIDGILQYSRLGRVKEALVEVDLGEAAYEALELVSPPDHITVELESQLPVIRAEKTRMVQIFGNLIGNSVKYMDKPRGRIRIGHLTDDENWQFYVADNGPGIDEKYFDKVFQIFQTLTPKDQFESTGVGLTLVKKMVEIYGGRIWIESEVGIGTTFFFEIPKERVALTTERSPGTNGHQTDEISAEHDSLER